MAGTVHSLENPQLVEQVEQEAAQAARQLAEAAHLRRGQIVVIGCSTSEVVGHQVGSWSTPEVADAIFRGLNSVFAPMGVYMAAQCCEHLNRALIVEQAAVPGAEIVNVVPQPKAGSSFATAHRAGHCAGGPHPAQVHRRRPGCLRRDAERGLPGFSVNTMRAAR